VVPTLRVLLLERIDRRGPNLRKRERLLRLSQRHHETGLRLLARSALLRFASHAGALELAYTPDGTTIATAALQALLVS